MMSAMTSNHFLIVIMSFQPDLETKVDPANKLDEMLRNLYGMSHIIAWGIFLPGAFFIVLLKCCLTCHDEYTYNQSRLIHKYEEIEDEVMDEKIQEVAKKQAEDNIGFFFHEPRLQLLFWKKITKIQKN